MEGGDIAAREDVCRGEGAGGLDAVEEKDLVGWRDEDDAVFCYWGIFKVNL